MTTYIISYDLSNPGRNYEELLRRIKAYGTWARLGGSAYLIRSVQTHDVIRNNLMVAIDKNDSIFVAVVTAPAAWAGLGDEVAQWLRNALQSPL